jgi:diguanylate cyclase (GGDEF)-like protein
VDLRLLAQAPIALFLADADGRCTFATDRLCELTGRPAAALMGQPWTTALRGHEVDLIEEPTGTVGIVLEDVVLDLRHRVEASEHDPVSGLLSRAAIFAHLGGRLADAREGVGPLSVGVLLCDIDEFDDVIGDLGPSGVDELVHAVAGRLRATVRSCDVVGRLERGAFVVLTEQERDPNAIEHVADRVLEVLDRPFRLHGTSVSLTASIGITVGDGAKTADHLLVRAADAAAEARIEGGACWRRADALHLVSWEP